MDDQGSTLEEIDQERETGTPKGEDEGTWAALHVALELLEKENRGRNLIIRS